MSQSDHITRLAHDCQYLLERLRCRLKPDNIHQARIGNR